MKEVYEYTISDTLELADPYAMAQVAEAMERAERIDIYTSAGNFCMADNFRFQMQEINVPVEVPHEAYMQKLAAANSNPFFHRHLLWGAQLYGGPDLSAAQAAALAHCAYHIHR